MQGGVIAFLLWFRDGALVDSVPRSAEFDTEDCLCLDPVRLLDGHFLVWKQGGAFAFLHRFRFGAIVDIGDSRFPMLSGSSGGYREWSPDGVCRRLPLVHEAATPSEHCPLLRPPRAQDRGSSRDSEVRTRELPFVELYEAGADCRVCTRPPF